MVGKEILVLGVVIDGEEIVVPPGNLGIFELRTNVHEVLSAKEKE
jgi:hypothetical protein